MFRLLRMIILVAIFAVAGAVLGRVAAEVRRRQEAGEDPADIDFRSIRVRPADIVPGLVAAVRVRDRPWSWLHIPSWMAAFGVNLAVAAAGGDFSRFRQMAERAAFSMTGIEFPGDDQHEDYDVYETYETRYASTAYAPEGDPEAATDAEPPSGAQEGTTWTVPGSEQPREERERSGGSAGGFTPFRD
jgi:hypothetical protein